MKNEDFEYIQVPISFKSDVTANKQKNMSQAAVIRDVKVVVKYDIPAIKRGKPTTKTMISEPTERTNSIFNKSQSADSVPPKPKQKSLSNNNQPISTSFNVGGQYGIVASKQKSIYQQQATPSNVSFPTQISGIELPKPLYSSPAAVQSSSKRREIDEMRQKEEEIRQKEDEIAKANMIILPPPSIISGQSSDREVAEYLAMSSLEKPETTFTRQLNLCKSVSDIFFFHKLLIIGDNVCRIAEVEFYQSPDPFAPQDLRLLTFSKFYFHRRGVDKQNNMNSNMPTDKNGEYSKGSKRGLYITMGSSSSGSAMLIRSIFVCGKLIDGKPIFNDSANDNMNDNKGKEEALGNTFIEGPGNVVKYILGILKQQTVDSLIYALKTEATKYGYNYTHESLLDFNLKFLPLHVVDFDLRAIYSKISDYVYNGPRVGLSLQKFYDCTNNRSHTQETYRTAQAILNHTMYFIMAPLRFTCMPGEVKEYKHYFALEAKRQFIPDAKITSDLKLNGELLAKWMRFFNKGLDMTLDVFLSQEYLKLDASINVKVQLHAFGFFSRFVDSMV